MSVVICNQSVFVPELHFHSHHLTTSIVTEPNSLYNGRCKVAVNRGGVGVTDVCISVSCHQKGQRPPGGRGGILTAHFLISDTA